VKSIIKLNGYETWKQCQTSDGTHATLHKVHAPLASLFSRRPSYLVPFYPHPVQYGTEVPAFLVDAEIRKRVKLAVDPRLSDDVRRRSTHQVLQDDLDAIVRMNLVEFWEVSGRVAILEVIFPMHVPSDGIEAVNGVQDV
jgi:hypothetical protein